MLANEYREEWLKHNESQKGPIIGYRKTLTSLQGLATIPENEHDSSLIKNENSFKKPFINVSKLI